jgi:hypothetical protein
MKIALFYKIGFHKIINVVCILRIAAAQKLSTSQRSTYQIDKVLISLKDKDLLVQ